MTGRVSLDSGVIGPRVGLPRAVTVADLRSAVAGERSWRGVMRALGFTTSRTGQVLKQVCEELGIDYGHFWGQPPQVDLIEKAVRASTTWAEAMDRLGFAPLSGSARATIRRRCELLGIDVSGLAQHLSAPAGVRPLLPQPGQLRHAGPYLVAAALTLAAVVVSWAPEGAAYDLIGDFTPGGPQRIQVKTVASGGYCNLSRKAYSSNGKGGHCRALYAVEDIDYFACVTFDQVVYLIPITLVEGRAGISLRKYSAYRLPGVAPAQ